MGYEIPNKKIHKKMIKKGGKNGCEERKKKHL
jgi:hypothetical protein